MQDIFLTDGASAGVKTVLEARPPSSSLMLLVLEQVRAQGYDRWPLGWPSHSDSTVSAIFSLRLRQRHSRPLLRSVLQSPAKLPEASMTRLGGTHIGYELVEDSSHSFARRASLVWEPSSHQLPGLCFWKRPDLVF